jgi:hypothetical protein
VYNSGAVYVTGYADTTTNGTYATAKFDTSGSLTWQRRLNPISASNAYGYNIAADSAGNLCVTGEDNGVTTVLFKLNASGVLQWQRYLTNTSGANLEGVVCDSSNNIYVTGSTVPFGRYGLVVKYNSSGAIQWQRQLQNTYIARCRNVAVDGSGNVYVTTINDNGGFGYSGVAKYDSSGAIQWQRELGDTTTFNPTLVGVCCDSAGNIYACGGLSTNLGNQRALIVKYNSSGVIQWQRTLLNSTTTQLIFFWGIAIDSGNNLCLSGYMNNTTSGKYEPIVARLPSDGSLTGTYGNWTYSSATWTEGAGTLTDAAGTATDAAGTATDAAGTLSNTTSALTSTVTYL